MSFSDNEKKRQGSDAGSDTKRHKPLHQLSEDGPLTQSDVVYFQKEAIWRQMATYKQRCQSLSRDLAKLDKQYESSSRKLHILSSWYEQILNLFASKVTQNGEAIDEKLLVKLSDNDDDELKTRRSLLLSVLTPLIENSKAVSPVDSQQLLDKVKELNSELVSVKSQNETLTDLKTKLEEKVEEMKEELFTLIRQRERKDSKTLKRVDDSLVKDLNGSVKQEETEQEKPSVVKEEGELAKKEGEVESSVDTEELERITAELEEFKATNKVLSKQVQEITEKYNKSQQEIVQLDNKLHHLDEADIADNAHYKRIVKNNQRLQEQISSLSKINSVNIARLNELEKKQNQVTDLLQREIFEENEQLKQQLHKSEADLVRIRTARDALISKEAILKSQIEDQKTNEELVKLNKVLNDRIDTLQKEQIAKLTEGSTSLDKLSKEELIERITVLGNEVSEVESAFKQAREISLKKLTSSDEEGMIRKLTIEKTKADQKYFASMRSKESLSAENKVMKAQISKSQELVKNLNDLEKSYLNKIEILTKSLDDYKTIKENSLQENTKLQDSFKSLQTSKETLEKEIKRCSSVIEKKSEEINNLKAELNQSQVTNAKLDKNLKSTESLLKKYKQNNTSSILQEDEQQLEALRSIAKCSVCSKNWKDTAITVCGHVFCHNCTQERLAARLRRCPSCNKGFSANDLLSVHL
ncbi:hypothetical protein G9P44_002884 [Scheffersomyces stipitis]|nr:hypothetical protein G9P44_002884 [Scheffersomyces stipitis]